MVVLATDTLRVDGANVAYSFLESTQSGSITLLFVHGYRENRRWWAHLAQECASFSNFVCIDLSGNGDSSHRTKYSFEQHADEILSVAQATSPSGRVILVASGLGYLAAVEAVRRSRNGLEGLILVDPSSSLAKLTEKRVPSLLRPFIAQQSFKTLDEGVAKFSALLTTFGAQSSLLDEIARGSLIKRNGRWYWKYDHFYTSKLERPQQSILWWVLASLELPIGIVHGGLSAEFGVHQLKSAKSVIPASRIISVESAGHFVHLDKPNGFVGAMAAMIPRIFIQSRSSDVNV